SVSAPRLLAVLGNTQVTEGTFEGQIAIAGTVASPTGDATIIARGIGVPPAGGGVKLQSLRELQLRAQWDGTAGKITIHGAESGPGTLDLVVNGRPDQLAAVTSQLRAHQPDLRRLAGLIP